MLFVPYVQVNWWLYCRTAVGDTLSHRLGHLHEGVAIMELLEVAQIVLHICRFFFLAKFPRFWDMINYLLANCFGYYGRSSVYYWVVPNLCHSYCCAVLLKVSTKFWPHYGGTQYSRRKNNENNCFRSSFWAIKQNLETRQGTILTRYHADNATIQFSSCLPMHLLKWNMIFNVSWLLYSANKSCAKEYNAKFICPLRLVFACKFEKNLQKGRSFFLWLLENL